MLRLEKRLLVLSSFCYTPGEEGRGEYCIYIFQTPSQSPTMLLIRSRTVGLRLATLLHSSLIETGIFLPLPYTLYLA